jgi:hypothetical protein
MAIEALPIFCYYDVQRFQQFGAMDCANWYGVQVDSGKKKQALYPCMGRQHVTFLNINRLIFNNEPRDIFRTVNFFYVIDGTSVIQVDANYNEKPIGSVSLGGKLWFAFLTVGTITYALLTDQKNIYVITENGTTVTYQMITDPNAPGGATTGGMPLYVAAFGNRFVVSLENSPFYYLTRTNLFSDSGDVTNCFTVAGSPLFNQASGIVRQLGVLHAQLYIFTDFTTDIWANIATQINVNGVITEFPWKLNSSYNWDYGIADDDSLDIDFGRMAWLGQNKNGLVTFMSSTGQQPEPISSQAINVLLQNSSNQSGISPFIELTADGFLYQYENSIFYRVSAGNFMNFQILDQDNLANCIEYNYGIGQWERCIELNGERNRIQKHIYFNNKHLVTVQGDPAIYEMAGNIYHNELRNVGTPPQAPNAFTKFPIRYELVTPPIFKEDYSEFIDDYVQIDFVFGDQTFYKQNAPFLNTVFIVDEISTPSVPVFLVAEDDTTFIIEEGTNTPTFDDNHYFDLFKPHIELYYSDDGGITYTTADLREFSPLGQYRWLMRWYELSISRNRTYKLVCVSSAPIVILGAVRNTRRASGGAN